MPAVTVDDILSLPRIDVTPDDGASPMRDRAVESITTAPRGFEGEGFPVKRAFAGVPLDRLDPFVHMDEMGEVEYAPGEPKGTPWHPHRGFETVTYMIDGTFQHRDSTGGGGLITNGDTQWMTAGSGILHIERPPEDLVASGGLFHGIQLWVNLPAAEQVGTAPLPGHRPRPGDPSVIARRWRPGAGHRRARGPTPRAGGHLHAHHHGARDRGSRRPSGAALGAGPQRPGLCPGRSGSRWSRAPAHRRRPRSRSSGRVTR